MKRIADDDLVCEVIRRVRGRMLKTGGYEGATMRSVLETLQPLMTHQEITDVFQRLLANKTIVLLGTLREHNPDIWPPGDQWHAHGAVHSLYPDIILRKERFYFSPAGSLLREARRNGKLIEPSQNTRHVCLYFGMCYVTADGLPKSVERTLKQPPLPHPALPECA